MPKHDTGISGTPGGGPRLLDLAREAIRRRHYSYRTEDTYLQWMKRFILFSGKRQLHNPSSLSRRDLMC